VAPERIDSGIRGAMFDGTGAAWGLAAPSALLHRLTLTWDVINAKWNEWILGYGPDNQNRFMKWLGMDDPDWRKMMLTLVATVAVLTGIISVLLMWRYRPPPKDRAAVLYHRFVNKTGVLPTTGETPIAFARRAGSRSALPVDTIEFVTTSYLDARYGPGDADAMRRLESAVAAL
jgi:hypothetical protein